MRFAGCAPESDDRFELVVEISPGRRGRPVGGRGGDLGPDRLSDRSLT